jgi:hypothetical protein
MLETPTISADFPYTSHFGVPDQQLVQVIAPNIL